MVMMMMATASTATRSLVDVKVASTALKQTARIVCPIDLTSRVDADESRTTGHAALQRLNLNLVMTRHDGSDPKAMLPIKQAFLRIRLVIQAGGREGAVCVATSVKGGSQVAAIIEELETVAGTVAIADGHIGHLASLVLEDGVNGSARIAELKEIEAFVGFDLDNLLVMVMIVRVTAVAAITAVAAVTTVTTMTAMTAMVST